jgi:hypothetical protein
VFSPIQPHAKENLQQWIYQTHVLAFYNPFVYPLQYVAFALVIPVHLEVGQEFAFASLISCSWRSSNRSCSSAGKVSHVGLILLVETSELSFELAIEDRS